MYKSLKCIIALWLFWNIFVCIPIFCIITLSHGTALVTRLNSTNKETMQFITKCNLFRILFSWYVEDDFKVVKHYVQGTLCLKALHLYIGGISLLVLTRLPSVYFLDCMLFCHLRTRMQHVLETMLFPHVGKTLYFKTLEFVYQTGWLLKFLDYL